MEQRSIGDGPDSEEEGIREEMISHKFSTDDVEEEGGGEEVREVAEEEQDEEEEGEEEVREILGSCYCSWEQHCPPRRHVESP